MTNSCSDWVLVEKYLVSSAPVKRDVDSNWCVDLVPPAGNTHSAVKDDMLMQRNNQSLCHILVFIFLSSVPVWVSGEEVEENIDECDDASSSF